MRMQGRRLADVAEGRIIPLLAAGEYVRVRWDEQGSWVWYGCAPDGSVCNLAHHAVTEHVDGSVTVDPSILIHPSGWHGYLRAGVWEEC